jgi:hypothetical protein
MVSSCTSTTLFCIPYERLHLVCYDSIHSPVRWCCSIRCKCVARCYLAAAAVTASAVASAHFYFSRECIPRAHV